MDTLIYWLARAFIALLQSLPLVWVARIGRTGGALAFWIDARHRRVALANLAMCFEKEKSPEEIRAIAKENFRRLGENYASAVKTSAMTFDELRPHVKYVGAESFVPPPRIVMAIGHFGNFELYARFKDLVPGHQCATTYRALKQPALNRLMESMRQRSGCLFFERRTDGHLLRALMNGKNVILGLLADQHAGMNGLRLPFFGHDCSTTPAPAVFALRYDCKLFTAFCFRDAPAHWRFELGDEISTHENGQARPVEAITLDINRSFEKAVRRDPANWFWVHKRWKPLQTKAKFEPPRETTI